MINLNLVRKENIQTLLLENAIGVEELANCLGVDVGMMSRKLSEEQGKISDKLARQIEQTFSKPVFWLDAGAADDSMQFDLLG
ncbi:hypothetical protein [Gynuella sunshinyii]|nr:hypothetical protein [Gynuella sunshinyii]